MKITMFVDSLGTGGAERVMTLLANRWAERGDDVAIATLFPAEGDFYPLHDPVCRITLGLTGPARGRLHALALNAGRVWSIGRILRREQPDVAVSFIDRMNVLVLAASLGLGVPVVVSERTDPRMETLDPIVRFLRARLYCRAAGIVAQTRSAAEWAGHLAPLDRITVIPNPVAPDLPRLDPSGTTIIGVGRLSREKGFDLLVDAFALFASAHPAWRLRIHGEGPERENLERQVERSPVAGRVSLPGIVPSPQEALRGAGMFVLSSRHEGFPNVVLEALALGVPTVAFACPSGPDEIITDGVDGLLVPPGDVEALAAAMARVADDPDLHRRLAGAGPVRARDFALPVVGRMWDEVIEQAIRRTQASGVTAGGPGSRRRFPRPRRPW